MKRYSFIIVVIFLAAIAVRLSVRLDQDRSRSVETPTTSAEPEDQPEIVDAEVARPASDPRKRATGLPPSPLDQLNHPDTSPENDVRLLALLFADYASVFKRVPLGMHEEIVAALKGENPRGIKYIPEGHPAVNSENKIVDRWDEPFFFHVISRNAVEIISSGPDRELFTEDDTRHVPPHATVEPAISMTE